MVTGRVTVVPRRTPPKSRELGSAAARLTPVPENGTPVGGHRPPASGHSRTGRTPDAGPVAVGVNDSSKVHVSPTGAARHVPPSKWKGGVRPTPSPTPKPPAPPYP